MKVTLIVLGILLAVILGFLYAGIIGAILFSLSIVLSLYLTALEKPSVKATGLRFLLFLCFGYGLMYFFGLLGAGEPVKRKLQLVKEELIKNKYNPRWVIISQKRNKLFNKMLFKSVDKSLHMEGKAIDVYVFDIDGDGSYNRKDVDLIEKANAAVERENPGLAGTLGIYLIEKNGYLTRHMIHFEADSKPGKFTR